MEVWVHPNRSTWNKLVLLDQGWVQRIDGRSLVHWCATRKGFTEAT